MAYILSVAACVPTQRVSNEDMLSTHRSELLKGIPDFAQTRLGINNRYWLRINEPAYPLTLQAAVSALERSPNTEIGRIIYLLEGFPGYNEKRKYNVPQRLQNDLRGRGFNVGDQMGRYALGDCSAYVSSLREALLYANAGINTLIVTEALHSPHLDPKGYEFLTFADMFTSTIVGSSYTTEPALEILSFFERSYPENWNIAYMEETPDKSYVIRTDPHLIKRFLPSAIQEGLEGLVRENNLPSMHQIDAFIPHQANKILIEETFRCLGISLRKVYLTISDYGNTGVSSIPHALERASEDGFLKDCGYVCLIGFGLGGVSCVLLKRTKISTQS